MARSVMGEKTSMMAALAGLAVAILAAHSDNPQIAEAAITTSQAYSVQNELSMTQLHEKEADRVGLQTMANAGFNPHGMAAFFKSLMSQDRLYESNVPGFLRTHPMTYERMADLENRAAEMKYKYRSDNPEYAIIRARVLAESGDPQDAFKRFRSLAVRQDDAATLYGLTLSALRAGEKGQAAQALARLEKTGRSALTESLGAQVLLETGQVDKAVTRLRSAVDAYPSYKPLAYSYAEALLRAGHAADAKSFLTDRQNLWPDDPVLYERLAEANQVLGRHAEEHLAQAEAYIRLDQTSRAIEQLQLARQSGDGDFYTQSVIDARLREYRDREMREKEANKARQ